MKSIHEANPTVIAAGAYFALMFILILVAIAGNTNESGKAAETAESATDFVYQFDSEPEHLSSLIYNCDGGILYLVLDAERLDELQTAFERHPQASQLYVSARSIATEPQELELEFALERKWLENALQDMTKHGYVSITLVKSISPGVVDGQTEVPSDTYRADVYLTPTIVDLFIANIEANAASGIDYCVIQQHLKIDQSRIGSFRIYYDELLAARELLSRADTRGVTYCVDIVPLTTKDL